MGCAEQLKIIRCANKLKQYHVADALGISRSTYCGYEIGRRMVDVETLSKLSHFYKLSMDAFFDDSFVRVVSEEEVYEKNADKMYLSQLSAEEISLVAEVRAMDDKDKKEVLNMAKSKVISKP